MELSLRLILGPYPFDCRWEPDSDSGFPFDMEKHHKQTSELTGEPSSWEKITCKKLVSLWPLSSKN